MDEEDRGYLFRINSVLVARWWVVWADIKVRLKLPEEGEKCRGTWSREEKDRK